MAWLVRDDEVLASLEIADGRRDRSRGLLGREGIEGAIYLTPCRSVHTFGMRFPIDVAFVDADLVVARIVSMRPGRITRPCWPARGAIEAEAGSFASWNLGIGDALEVRR
ncbi:MAG: DUF192 domain-containing protein [Acidimicrobiales bacterium]|nr:DUF192 domain-containing protein [Acidimicrobiales bacterium]